MRELHVVYVDPGLAGSERNLELVAAWAPTERQPTPFTVRAHRGERFEHASLLTRDATTRVHLYSRCSALYATEHVDAHLIGLASVVVMVVDARDFRVEAAIDRWARVEAGARAIGRDPDAIPLVGQLNRPTEAPGRVEENGAVRDVRHVTVDEVRGRVLPERAEWVDACTRDGSGVLATLRAAVAATARS